MKSIYLVVPCFNEASRLKVERFQDLASQLRKSDIDVTICFVDDGSTDETPILLSSILAEKTLHVEVLRSDANHGKAEAIRLGLLNSSSKIHDLVGYMDSDFAIPEDAVVKFVRTCFLFPEREIFLASRIRLAGGRIIRKTQRHFTGRLVAAVVRRKLHFQIYDSQCGLKLFQQTEALERSLGHAFRYRWMVDLELLLRVHRYRGLDLNDFVLEVPIYFWEDVSGSKVTLLAAIKETLSVMFLRA